MLVQRFIAWSRTASVEDRVRAVSKVCEAYRFASVPESERRTSVAVMTVALDDPSPSVRLALAEVLAACEDAPRHLLIALARDVPAVAAPILAGAVALDDGDLLHLVLAGDEACAHAVASRPRLSPELARAVIEAGDTAAVARLMDNVAVRLGPEALERVASRFDEDAGVRTRLLAAEGLSADTARRLRAIHAAALCAFVTDRNWLSVGRARALETGTREAGLLEAACEARGDELCDMLDAAIRAGEVTPSLLLRAIVSGQIDMVEHGIAILAGCPKDRVASAFRSKRASVLGAILLRAGIGAEVGTMLSSAHALWREADGYAMADAQTEGTRVLRKVVRALSVQCGARTQPAIVRLLADLELEIERHAAHNHSEQLLLAA